MTKLAAACLAVTIALNCTRERPGEHAAQSAAVLGSGVHAVPLDSLEAQNCASIRNTYDCARAIERQLLSHASSKALRSGDTLSIVFTNGTTRRFIDKIVDSSLVVAYSYRAHLAPIGYHVLELQYVEGGGFMLVSARTGDTTDSNGLPFVSPDRRRVAAASSDPDAQFSPNTVQIWRIERDRLRLEWEHDFMPGNTKTDTSWGPTQLQWIDDQTIRVVKEQTWGVTLGFTYIKRTGDRWQFATQ